MTMTWQEKLELDSLKTRAELDMDLYGPPDPDCGQIDPISMAEILLRLITEALSGAHDAQESFVLPDWLVEYVVHGNQLGGPPSASEGLQAWALARIKARGVWREPTIGQERSKGRQGQVYVVYRHRDKAIKIGFSTNPLSRLSALRTASGDDLILAVHFPGSVADERSAHARFAECKIDLEWFHLTDELRDWIRDLGGNI